ncbi:MAG: NAD(P)/FAD-dependent oxidoreductase, partial [Saprospiraceae bacterium]|nr:NAD(P)/FAD-dependent oxidoreductase [Saprospiraceae bacterium]
FPADYPTYVSRDQLVAYFEDYARHFSIQPEFDTEVTSVRRHDDGGWELVTNRGQRIAERVVIATGVNQRPNIPHWRGQEAFRGTVTHSIGYRNPQPFLGRKTLVIGMGNTGAEIALDLAEHGVPTWISVRGPVNIVPRDLNGRPVQETGRILARLPFGIGEWIGAQVQSLYFGDLSKYGLKRSRKPPAVQLRETGKTPVIDIGTIRAIKEGRITVIDEVARFTEQGVVTITGETLEIDRVILATGYHSCLADLIEQMDRFLDPRGYPLSPIGTGYHAGLYFVGFDNYKLGGILGTIYNDSETVVSAIRSNHPPVPG